MPLPKEIELSISAVMRRMDPIRRTQWLKLGDHPAVLPGQSKGTGYLSNIDGEFCVMPGDFILDYIDGFCAVEKPDPSQ